MDNNPIVILKRFKDNLVIFMDELIATLPEEADLIIARIFIKDQVPIQDIMNFVIMNILPLSEHIKNKEEKVFLTNSSIYQGVSSEKVLYYKNLWFSGELDEDDKETIWAWLNNFIMMTERYVQCTHTS